MQEILIGGRWRQPLESELFDTYAPATGAKLRSFPTSPWAEIDEALDGGYAAYRELGRQPPEMIASFLESYAEIISASTAELAAVAHEETALPTSPRFDQGEIPRTANQLKMAAEAARSRAWVEPTLSPQHKIASRMAPIPGVVCVFGPNNFPFAFNGVSGGDFAAAIATGHPVLAKANPGHPETTRRLARLALEALHGTSLPAATVQLVYRTSHPDGARLVGDPRVAATAYTGSRAAGLALKHASDEAGNPIYLEMSSVNPVVVLEGAIRERGQQIVDELVQSLLLGAGQFCTSPGLLFVIDSAESVSFLAQVGQKAASMAAEPLLGAKVAEGLQESLERWERAGADLLSSGDRGGSGASFPNTVMRASGEQFLARAEELQTEAFGNMSLAIVADSLAQIIACIASLEGNLTGTVYSASDGADDQAYATIEPWLREKVGRLLNDKAPTGVAVVPAMNHGGPYPATGHPGFTAVGMPASLRRFASLQCYDNVPDQRLPAELQAANPLHLVRRVDDLLTDRAVVWGAPSA